MAGLLPAVDSPRPALDSDCEIALDVWVFIGSQWQPERIADACTYLQLRRLDGLIERLMTIRNVIAELRGQA